MQQKVDTRTVEEVEFAKNLGHRIHQRRTELGMTQYELAFLSDTERFRISAYECGHCSPRVYTLHRIAKAMGVSMAYFEKPLRHD
jgi:transcriptional regulator with XRE-family HTH domain